MDRNEYISNIQKSLEELNNLKDPARIASILESRFLEIQELQPSDFKSFLAYTVARGTINKMRSYIDRDIGLIKENCPFYFANDNHIVKFELEQMRRLLDL